MSETVAARVRYGLAADKTPRLAWMTARIGQFRRTISSTEWPRKEEGPLDGGQPCGNRRERAPERSYHGKVHGNCVTVHKASHALHFILLSTVLGDTTHLPGYREGTITANGIVLAATGKCGRRLIGRVPQLRDRFLYRFRNGSCTWKHLHTLRSRFRIAVQRKERWDTFSGRVIYLPGRNETQIRREIWRSSDERDAGKR